MPFKRTFKKLLYSLDREYRGLILPIYPLKEKQRKTKKNTVKTTKKCFKKALKMHHIISLGFQLGSQASQDPYIPFKGPLGALYSLYSP